MFCRKRTFCLHIFIAVCYLLLCYVVLLYYSQLSLFFIFSFILDVNITKDDYFLTYKKHDLFIFCISYTYYYYYSYCFISLIAKIKFSSKFAEKHNMCVEMKTKEEN